ncbi:MAG: exodeoxyribonuclease VII small subunit [Prevotella sp.]|nr:exodeoxyribonuclease VII small subunit [Prevotella sp.]
MDQQVKYEEAMRQLEEIVAKIENNELDIDQLTTQLKKAKELISFCKEKLVKTDEEIKQIIEEQ